MPPQEAFALDPQLARDTVAVGDLPLSRLLLHADANYPWLVLVPRCANIVEIADLDEAARTQLMDEITTTSDALKTITRCDKLNVAALGNMVPQLHVHIIARRKTDAAWPRPVWGAVPPLAYREDESKVLLGALRSELGLEPIS